MPLSDYTTQELVSAIGQHPAEELVNFIEDRTPNFDTINEFTENSGTTVEGVLLKDTTIDVNGTADAVILDADADTHISAPTDDQIDIALNGTDHVVLQCVAGADAGTTKNIMEIAFTSPVDTTGTNTHNGLVIDVEIGNATGGTNSVVGLQIDNITGDAQVTETAINIGTGWDSGITCASPLAQGATAADRVTVKGIYMTPANVVVAVPSIADNAAENADSVAVDVSAALTMQPAVGDAVIALPQEALPTDCLLCGCYVTNTDEITLTFASKEGGSGVTGANKNFKFLVLDLT